MIESGSGCAGIFRGIALEKIPINRFRVYLNKYKAERFGRINSRTPADYLNLTARACRIRIHKHD